MLRADGYHVNKHRRTPEELKAAKKALSVVPRVDTTFTNGRPPPPVRAFTDTPRELVVPRLFGLRTFGPVEFADRGLIKDASLAFAGQLKKLELVDQSEACAAVMAKLDECGGAILSLPTGCGKTACALYIAARLGKRIAVVVHNEPLLIQWRERVQQFLPGASIGEVRGPKMDVDKDVTLCMIQSICSRDYPLDLLATCGFVIIDEVHHVAARVFQGVFRRATRPFTLGLSATPKRKDGLEILLEFYIGPIAFHVQLVVPGDVEARIVHFQAKESPPIPLTQNGNVSLPGMINILVEMEERNEMIVNTIRELASMGREILVLSDRRDHCTRMHEMLGMESSCVFIGGVSPDVIENCQVIFATYALCSEGFDCPRLSTLILATPRADIVQAAGRVMRSGDARKHSPLIVDVADLWGPLFGQARKRMNYFTSSGFTLDPAHQPSTAESRLNRPAVVEFFD
jgi:hypothetical protein